MADYYIDVAWDEELLNDDALYDELYDDTYLDEEYDENYYDEEEYDYLDDEYYEEEVDYIDEYGDEIEAYEQEDERLYDEDLSLEDIEEDEELIREHTEKIMDHYFDNSFLETLRSRVPTFGIHDSGAEETIIEKEEQKIVEILPTITKLSAAGELTIDFDPP